MISAVRKEAEQLTARGIKIIIALGHAGYPKDIEIAKRVSQVDLVVGGHSNTFLYSGRKLSLVINIRSKAFHMADSQDII